VTTLDDFGGVLEKDGLRTLSFGLSQFHGHNSWLVCEVALNLYVCMPIRAFALANQKLISISTCHYISLMHLT
jgi:hypothetical protein